jgi:lipopolysaccharide transport system ATP-binding protein
MSKTVISVENLTKRYDLGVIGTGTLSRDLNRWWARVRHQPDPYTKIGKEDPFKRRGESILALNDVSFTVQQGEALGIIGKNGAGKSTLLKILSRVTAPTSGVVKVKGRIGSLLEVGTGFHPELTGRENIFLNGAILGMRKEEVGKKFDEIVDFSGVEKFIDTPVKRYSSGMYVRLAFAVAAHLDPEILVVDEVLAVGDAEFQKKCLGKMGDVAGEGRTVLFVSHNMTAIQNLCNRSLVLKQGTKEFDGETSEAVFRYLKTSSISKTEVVWDDHNAPGNDKVKLLKAWIKKPNSPEIKEIFSVEDDLEIDISFVNLIEGETVLDITLHLRDERNNLVFVTGSGGKSEKRLNQGRYKMTCKIPKHLLNQGTYTINRLLFVKDYGHVIFEYPDALIFDVVKPGSGSMGWMGKKEGIIRPILPWTIKKIDQISRRRSS